MFRRTVVVMAAVVVPLLVIPAGVASARLHTHPDPLFGLSNCGGAWTGTLTFNPPLINGGTAASEVISIKAVAKPCTGGTPLSIKGKVKGKGVIAGTGANNCASSFAGGTFPFSSGGFVEVIKWDPTSVPDSYPLFPSVTESNTAHPPYVNLLFNPGPVTGSYATTNAGTQSITTMKTLATITGAGSGDCGSAGGVHSLVIRGSLTSGTF